MDILKREVILLLLSIFLHQGGATGGPIQHSNGLCILPKNDKTTGLTLLVWSTKCFSQEANFLVSYDYSIYHIDSERCFFPKNGRSTEPGITGKFVLDSKTKCRRLKFRPLDNGYLGYYTTKFVDVCIGEGRDSHEPVEGDEVMLSKKACKRTESCQHLSCVYELTVGTYVQTRILCPSSFLIQVTWAYYGTLEQKVPVKFRVSNCDVNTITNLIKKKCDGGRECLILPDSVLKTSCSENNYDLVVRYSCIQENKPAEPSQVTIHVLGMNKLKMTWSPQETKLEDPIDWYSVCWNTSTNDRKCNNGNIKSLSIELNHLTSSTKYFVYVASHSCKGGIGTYSEPKIGITRAAPIKQSNKRSSAKNFEIFFGVLKSDDKYIQIIVKRQVNKKQPIKDPDSYSILRSYNETSTDNVPYIAAELGRDYVKIKKFFTVGDGKRYSKSTNRERRDVQYLNVKLEPDTYYSVFQRTFKNDDLYYNSEWMEVVQTVDTKDNEKPTPDQPDQNQGDKGGKTSGLIKNIVFIIPLSVVPILLFILILLLIVFRKKLGCCVRKNNESTEVVIDTTAAEEGYTEMVFLDKQNENQYQNMIDRENQLQNSDCNEHLYAELSSRREPENPYQSLETTSHR